MIAYKDDVLEKHGVYEALVETPEFRTFLNDLEELADERAEIIGGVLRWLDGWRPSKAELESALRFARSWDEESSNHRVTSRIQLSEEDKQKIKDDHRPYMAIAADYDIPYEKVVNIKRSGIPKKKPLTAAQVRAIRADTRPNAEIVNEYGVSSDVIYRVKRGLSYSHIPGSPKPKGRQVTSPEIVRAVRAAQGTHREIGEKFGLHQTTVTKIRNRETHTDVV